MADAKLKDKQPVAGNAKDKNLEIAISQIEKEFGKGSIMRLGDSRSFADVAVISTGSLELDIALGVYGVPRGRIMRDEALYDIANQAPTAVEQLAQLRTLSDGFARSARAREIIDVVKRGLAKDMKAVPSVRQGEPLSAEATATLELLKVLLKAAAAKNGVAPRLIADSSDLELIAAQDEPNVPAMHGWRRRLFGDDALALKRGELALTLHNGEVAVRRV